MADPSSPSSSGDEHPTETDEESPVGPLWVFLLIFWTFMDLLILGVEALSAVLVVVTGVAGYLLLRGAYRIWASMGVNSDA